MRAVDAAMTNRLSALAIGGRAVPARVDPARLVHHGILHLGLGVLLAVCLLVASSHKVWGQLCVCAEPGMMTCSLLGHTSHEPATSAFPQCQLHARGGGGRGGGGGSGGGRHEQFRKRPVTRGTHPHIEYGAGRLPRPPAIGGGGGDVGGGSGGPVGGAGAPAVNPPPPAAFNPATGFQIAPLNCPRGSFRTGQTFYGGTRCAPMPMPSPAAGIQLPPDADDQSSTDGVQAGGSGGQPVQPIFGDTEPLSGPASAPQLGAPPSPSQFNNTQAGVLANANLLDVAAAAVGVSKPMMKALAVAGAAALAVGFAGPAVVMPLVRAWP